MTEPPLPSPKQWAQGLRERRIAARMDRPTLAALSCLSPRTIQAFEVGARNPSIAAMIAIDTALAGSTTNADLVSRIEAVEAKVEELARGAA